MDVGGAGSLGVAAPSWQLPWSCPNGHRRARWRWAEPVPHRAATASDAGSFAAALAGDAAAGAAPDASGMAEEWWCRMRQAVAEFVDEGVARSDFALLAAVAHERERVGADIERDVAADLDRARVDAAARPLEQEVLEVVADHRRVGARSVRYGRQQHDQAEKWRCTTLSASSVESARFHSSNSRAIPRASIAAQSAVLLSTPARCLRRRYGNRRATPCAVAPAAAPPAGALIRSECCRGCQQQQREVAAVPRTGAGLLQAFQDSPPIGSSLPGSASAPAT
ncbi:MAG: hypothetical protein U1F11_14245 [Steroidobacteraceae bacterium]